MSGKRTRGGIWVSGGENVGILAEGSKPMKKKALQKYRIKVYRLAWGPWQPITDANYEVLEWE